MQEKIKISAIIKTKNSDETLYELLESIKSFDEIIALDLHSNDDTTDILKEYKVKTIFCDKNDFNQTFVSALKDASNNWVFYLESDEILPLTLIEKISILINEQKSPKENVKFMIKTFSSFDMQITNAKELKIARKTNVLRLFKKDKVKFLNPYLGLFASDTNKTISIKPSKTAPNDAILKLKKDDIENEILKIIDKNKTLIKYSKRKHSYPKTLFCAVFLYYYLLKGGICDGLSGFRYSFLKAIEKYIFEIMLMEKQEKILLTEGENKK